MTLPAEGRSFGAERKVRVSDVGPHGWLRLDAMAAYLQDIGGDDSGDAGLPRQHAWLVRRTALDIRQSPRLGEPVALVTFCSGIGARWAERTTTIRGERGAEVDATAIWVCTDVATGKPVPPPARFHEVYGPSAGGRKVSARLTIGDADPEGARRPWPLRATDFDVLGHMNNAAYWIAIEDEVDRRTTARPRHAVLEYRASIEPNDSIELVWREAGSESGLTAWLTRGAEVCAAAQVAW